MGEPINADAWHWYNEVVGEGKCTVVDTWWQTGTARDIVARQASKLSNLPGVGTSVQKGNN